MPLAIYARLGTRRVTSVADGRTRAWSSAPKVFGMPNTTDTTPAGGTAGGYRTTATTVMRILAMATGTLAVIQFALAGFGAFDDLQNHKGYGPHEFVGSAIGGFTVAILIAALIARPSTRTMILAGILFILAAPIQPLLASAGKHTAWVGGLHALVGVAILALCGMVSLRVPPAS